jgi:nitrile hydratase subunit beta
VNGIHDMGGMHGFGPVVREQDEPVFHGEFERRTFALALAMMGGRHFNVDEYRRTIERMPPAQYLAASYYEKWLYALEHLLIEKGVVARREIDVVMEALRAVGGSNGAHRAAVRGIDEPHGSPAGEPHAGEVAQHENLAVASTSAAADETKIARVAANSAALSEAIGGGARSLRFDRSFRPRFKPGDRVIARNLNPEGHTRLPRYARGHHGTIHRDWGIFVFPDTHAHGGGTKPQHCYAVEFDGRELWGEDHPVGECVYIDLWEDYLDFHLKADTGEMGPRSAAARKHSSKSGKAPKPGAKARATKPSRRVAAKNDGRGTQNP